MINQKASFRAPFHASFFSQTTFPSESFAILPSVCRFSFLDVPTKTCWLNFSAKLNFFPTFPASSSSGSSALELPWPPRPKTSNKSQEQIQADYWPSLLLVSFPTFLGRLFWEQEREFWEQQGRQAIPSTEQTEGVLAAASFLLIKELNTALPQVVFQLGNIQSHQFCLRSQNVFVWRLIRHRILHLGRGGDNGSCTDWWSIWKQNFDFNFLLCVNRLRPTTSLAIATLLEHLHLLLKRAS
jgi:hypothetical protein